MTNHARDRRIPAKRRHYRPVVEQLESRRLFAGVAELLADITPGSGSSYQTPQNVYGAQLKAVESGGRTFFVAENPTSGYQLWTQGNGGGPVTPLVTLGYSYSSNVDVPLFRTANGMVYVVASTGGSSGVLKRIDPNTLTVINSPVKINEVQITPGRFAVVGDSLYARSKVLHPVTGQEVGDEIARVDLTTGAVTYVGEVRPGARSLFVSNVTAAGGNVYFVTDDGTNGNEVWSTDGVNTYFSGNVTPSGNSPFLLTPVGESLYYVVRRYDRSLDQLWKIDRPGVPPKLIMEIREVLFRYMIDFEGDLLFATYDYTNANSLWRAHASDDSLELLTSSINAMPTPDVTLISVMNGNAYFVGSGFRGQADQHTPQLWITDGTAAGTRKLRPFEETQVAFPSQLTPVGNLLYFVGYTSAAGTELWQTDGTADGTVMLPEIYPGHTPQGVSTLNGSSFFAAGGNLVFAADDGVHGTEPWVVRDKPDLRATSFGMNDLPPRDVNDLPGSQLSVHFELLNGSNFTSANASRLHIVLSRDTNFDSTDTLLESVDIASLGKDETYGGDVTVTFPADMLAGGVPNGNWYVGLIVDAADDVSEASESNNANRGLGIDWVVLYELPAVVQILTHGYKPPTDDWDVFRESWRTEYPEALRNLSAETAYYGQTYEYVSEWDSADGWNQAFLNAALAVWMKGAAQLPIPGNLAAQIYSRAIAEVDLAMDRAASNARSAAARIVRELTGPGGPLGSPDQHQVIHLIGHSRGAAVNAEVSRLLASKDYVVSQFTSLDGFSTDWPDGAWMLGDISIVDQAFGNRKINYRVEKGLAAAGIPTANQWLQDTLSFLLLRKVSIDPLTWLEQYLADWRAPNRPGFENVTITGTGATPYSNHVNVSDLYFESGARYGAERYIAQSPLFLPPNNSGGGSGGGGEGDGAHPRDGDFLDGSFEWLGQLLAMSEQIGDLTASGDEFLALWAEASAMPRNLLDEVWNISGAVSLRRDVGNTLVELRSGADGALDATTLGQVVTIDCASPALRFDLNTTGTSGGDRLLVQFNDVTLAELDLTSAVGRQTVSLQSVACQTGELRWKLVPAANSNVSVELDNLQVLAAGAIGSLTLAFDDPQTPAKLNVTVSDIASSTKPLIGVVFYLETNGVGGLQEGQDRFVDYDGYGGDGWTTTIPAAGLRYGVDRIYAAAWQGELGPVATGLVLATAGEQPWNGQPRPLDVNRDQFVASDDALIIINDLNSQGTRALDPPLTIPAYFVDVDGDNSLAPIDALIVINWLNSQASGEGEEQEQMLIDFPALVTLLPPRIFVVDTPTSGGGAMSALNPVGDVGLNASVALKTLRVADQATPARTFSARSNATRPAAFSGELEVDLQAIDTVLAEFGR